MFYSEECKDEYRVKVNVEKVRHHYMKYKCTTCGKTFKAYIPNSLKEENQYGSSVQALALQGARFPVYASRQRWGDKIVLNGSDNAFFGIDI